MRFFKGTLRTVPEKAEAVPGEHRGLKGAPELSSGIRVEVLTMENHLLFVGRMKILDGGVLELRRDTGDRFPRRCTTARSSSGAFSGIPSPFA